jgi:hypothetical protein
MKPRSRRTADPEKSRQRKVIIFSLVMIGLMVFSVAEVILYRGGSSDGSKLDYGKYAFSYKDYGNGRGVLVTQINGQDVEFQSLPVQVGDLAVDPNAISLMKGSQQLILTVDPNITQQEASTVDYARLELGLAIPKTVPAITAPDERYTLPVVNCSRATPETPVLLFNMSNETGLKAYGSCLVLNAEQGDILRMKDRIIFEYYGILKDGQVVE